jgi:hypothetical protein
MGAGYFAVLDGELVRVGRLRGLGESRRNSLVLESIPEIVICVFMPTDSNSEQKILISNKRCRFQTKDADFGTKDADFEQKIRIPDKR